MPLIYFYTPWKNQKTSNFLRFYGGIEEINGMKWVNEDLLTPDLHIAIVKRLFHIQQLFNIYFYMFNSKY